MTKTLAELRAEPVAKLPTRSERLCLNLDLLGRVQRLNAEKADLIVNAINTERDEDEDEAAKESKARVRKMFEREETEPEPELPPRVAEIEDELARLWDEMRDYEGDLLLRGIDPASWQAYKDKNPPRDGHPDDTEIGRGKVNTTALLGDLGDWVAAWNDEDLAAGDWTGWLSKKVASADASILVRRVVEMQENRVSIPPKVLTGSPSTTSPESAGA